MHCCILHKYLHTQVVQIGYIKDHYTSSMYVFVMDWIRKRNTAVVVVAAATCYAVANDVHMYIPILTIP